MDDFQVFSIENSRLRIKLADTQWERFMEKAFDKQTGGSHYKDMKIQPMEFALANNLNYGQSNAIKYICRYANKNGKQDLEKAIHCLELLMEYEYSEE